MDTLPSDSIRDELIVWCHESELITTCKTFYDILSSSYASIDFWRRICWRRYRHKLLCTDPVNARQIAYCLNLRAYDIDERYAQAPFSTRREDEWIAIHEEFSRRIVLPSDGTTVYPRLLLSNGDLVNKMLTHETGRYQFYNNLRCEDLQLLCSTVAVRPAEIIHLVAGTSNLPLLIECMGEMKSFPNPTRVVIAAIKRASLEVWLYVEQYVPRSTITDPKIFSLANLNIARYLANTYPQSVTVPKLQEMYESPSILCDIIEDLKITIPATVVIDPYIRECKSVTELRRLMAHINPTTKSVLIATECRRQDLVEVLIEVPGTKSNPNTLKGLMSNLVYFNHSLRETVIKCARSVPASVVGDAIVKQDDHLFDLLISIKHHNGFANKVNTPKGSLYVLEAAFYYNYRLKEVVDLGCYNNYFRPSFFLTNEYRDRLLGVIPYLRLSAVALDTEMRLCSKNPPVRKALEALRK